MFWVLIYTMHLTVCNCHIIFVYKLSCCGFESSCSHLNFRVPACFRQGVHWHSGNYRVRIHSKSVRDMTITYRQMHRTDKYSQHSSIIWPVWLNAWVFVYKLSGCWFESHCSSSVCFKKKKEDPKLFCNIWMKSLKFRLLLCFSCCFC